MNTLIAEKGDKEISQRFNFFRAVNPLNLKNPPKSRFRQKEPQRHKEQP